LGPALHSLSRSDLSNRGAEGEDEAERTASRRRACSRTLHAMAMKRRSPKSRGRCFRESGKENGKKECLRERPGMEWLVKQHWRSDVCAYRRERRVKDNQEDRIKMCVLWRSAIRTAALSSSRRPIIPKSVGLHAALGIRKYIQALERTCTGASCAVASWTVSASQLQHTRHSAWHVMKAELGVR